LEERGDGMEEFFFFSTRVTFELGDYLKAVKCGYRALEITKSAFGEDHFHVSSILLRLGILQTSLSQFEEAKNSFEVARRIRTNNFGREHGYVADVLHEEGKMYKKFGEKSKAQLAWTQALKIRTVTRGAEHKLTRETKECLREIGVL
jgi:tetratricopeptide (TPR) repeat protein